MKTKLLEGAILDTIKHGTRYEDRDQSWYENRVDWMVKNNTFLCLSLRSVTQSHGTPEVFIVLLRDVKPNPNNIQWGVFSLKEEKLILPMGDYSGIGFGGNGDDEKNPKYLQVRSGHGKDAKEDLFSLVERKLMGFEKMSPTYSWEGFWSVCVGDKWGMFSIGDDKLVVPIEYKEVSMAPREKDWKKRKLVLVVDTDDRRALYSLESQSIRGTWHEVVK